MAATITPYPQDHNTEFGYASVLAQKVVIPDDTEETIAEFDTSRTGARSISVQVEPLTLNLTVKWYVSLDRLNWTAIDVVDIAGSAQTTSSGVSVTAESRDTFVLDYTNDPEHMDVRWHKLTGVNASDAENTIIVHGCAK